MSTFVIGDIHGYLDRLCALLRGADLVDDGLNWSGGVHRLWLLGDLFDRGPGGLDVLRLVMRLQHQASPAGGSVNVLLGNHEALILAALKFSRQPTGGPGGTFLADWEINGGNAADLDGLTPVEAAWLAHLPVLGREDGTIFAHADSEFYMLYGQTIEDVNLTVADLLAGEDACAWETFMHRFAMRMSFFRSGLALSGFLNQYGGKRLVHGHTPVYRMSGRPARSVISAFEYREGRCVNVDGGMYLGGQGFVFRLP